MRLFPVRGIPGGIGFGVQTTSGGGGDIGWVSATDNSLNYPFSTNGQTTLQPDGQDYTLYENTATTFNSDGVNLLLGQYLVGKNVGVATPQSFAIKFKTTALQNDANNRGDLVSIGETFGVQGQEFTCGIVRSGDTEKIGFSTIAYVGGHTYSTTNNIIQGDWNNLVVSTTSSTVDVWLNGVKTSVSHSGLSFPVQKLGIGVTLAVGYTVENCLIKDLKVFSRQLTNSDIIL